MSEAYTGEIKAFPYTYAPEYWLECDGQAVSISQYMTLYSVIGTQFGGDGQTTFNLPNLMGSVALGMGKWIDPNAGLITYQVGNSGGSPSVELTTSQLPSHQHAVTIKLGSKTGPTGNAVFLANPTGADIEIPGTRVVSGGSYTPFAGFDNAANSALNPLALAAWGTTPVGGHPNNQPFLALRFCICYEGNYPIKPS
jgi:microcystin-dependent protein